MKRFGSCALLALLIASCGEPPPASLVADADPFLYNGAAAFPLPVRALDADGQVVEHAISASTGQPHIVELKGNAGRCLQAGDANINVSAGNARTRFRIECRPIASFGPPLEALDLVVGGPAVPIPVNAFDSAGHPVAALRFAARTSDTAVIAIVDGTVIPRVLGAAKIELDFGGVRTFLNVEVLAAEYRDTVALAAGEYRRWDLGPGRYISQFALLDAASAQPPLAWRSLKANCAFELSRRARMHCGLADSGAVILFATRPVRAAVRIDRKAD